MGMRRLHLSIGLLALVAFLLTGQFLRYHRPPLSMLDPAVRMLFRSRHIYILASALVNLMPGLYLEVYSRGWRCFVRTFGSALLLVSPVLLVLAFFTEPAKGFQPELPWSHAGLYALFLGSMGHLAASIGQPRKHLK
jgi:hypothetical protein